MIKKTEVKTFLVECICDNCGEGKMKPTGTCLTSNPPQYPHVCDKCGATVTVLDMTFPYKSYEVVT